MKKFLVFTRGRTGSTIICDTFDKVRHVACGQELVRPYGEAALTQLNQSCVDFEKFERTYSDVVSDTSVLPFMPYSILHEGTDFPAYFEYLREKFSDFKAVGFKALGNHLGSNDEEWIRIFNELRAEGIKIIYLQRSDQIREAFSISIARARKIYNVKKDEQDKIKSLEGTINIDPKEISKEVAFIDNWRKRITKILDTTESSYKAVYFEDFLADKRNFFHGLHDFLELDITDSNLEEIDFDDEGYLRVTPNDLGELIENYDEIMRHLRS